MKDFYTVGVRELVTIVGDRRPLRGTQAYIFVDSGPLSLYNKSQLQVVERSWVDDTRVFRGGELQIYVSRYYTGPGSAIILDFRDTAVATALLVQIKNEKKIDGVGLFYRCMLYLNIT